MYARVLYVCVLVVVLLELATVGLAALHGHDYSVCNATKASSSTNNVQRPNVTNQFHTRIEVVIVNKKKTDTVHEYFDATNNRGYLSKKDQSISYDYWYDYSTNEFILYYPQLAGFAGAPACTVSDLSQSSQRYLFGYEKINGNPHIFSAAGALHFGGMGVEEVYMGQTVIRNINVDWWRSCQYWNSMDATMTVDWYFTSRTTWDATVGVGAQLPVQAHVTGMAYNVTTGQGHHFDHYYNFFDFKPYLDDNSVFETPAGVTCPGRKLTRPFPTVAKDAFSFTTEIVDVDNDDISFMKETFYYSKKLVKYEYRPHPEDFSPYGTKDLIEIHDFHSGVAYITDAAQGNCSVRAIEGGDFDERSVGMNKVRIRTANEFFYFDTKNVVYEGIKKNRNIDCDTWIATRSDFPFGASTNSTWEWYFATNQWQQLNSGPEAGAIPVQMRITIPSLGWNQQYNIFYFQKSKPDLLKFDISGCYQFRKRRKFQFMVPANNQVQSQISSNVEVFKYYVLQAIMSSTKISPLRVAHLQVFFTDTIIVTFELLDVSPIVGDTQRAPDYSEVALDFAANTIAQMIQNGQFVIPLKDSPFTNIRNLVATANSIMEITYLNSTTGSVTKTTGYGAGPMAAVGVTMPLLGGGLGILFAYFFFK